MMRLFFILISMHLQVQTFAQDRSVDVRCNRVIAADGLRLRAGPGQQHRVLSVIPFGDTVHILEQKSYGADTITTIGGPDARTVEGRWLHVQYRRQKGFVLDAFLYTSSREQLDQAPDWRFLLPEDGCMPENIYPPGQWHWYGYFCTDSVHFIRKKIELRYYHRSRDYITDLLIQASDMRGLQFIIGTRSEVVLPEKTVSIPGFPLEKQVIPDESQRFLLPLTVLLEGGGPALQKKPQLPLSTRLYFKNYWQTPDRVYFAGDLDGDKKTDYIIDTGGETGYIALFLSTRAGAVWKPVAIYRHYYCC